MDLLVISNKMTITKRTRSIDHETDYGVTCLIAASEEDVGRLNYAPMLNDDGTLCLAVEYLLDRYAIIRLRTLF